MAALHQMSAQAVLRKPKNAKRASTDEAVSEVAAPPSAQAEPANAQAVRKGLTGVLYRFIEHPWFSHFILTVIIINATALGLETIPAVKGALGPALVVIDRCALWIFVVELALKLVVHRHRFFTNGWNVFDFVIVGLAFLPASGTSILRALRVLRVLRLISAIPSLRVVVQALVSAVPSMTTVIGLLMLFFYVFGVMATRLYAEAMPDKFGSLPQTFLTLFQLMIMDGWAEVIRGLMQLGHTTAALFFIIFVVISGFAVLNLFIGILVNAMDRAESLDHALHPEDYREEPADQLEALSAQIAELQANLNRLSAQNTALLARLEAQLESAPQPIPQAPHSEPPA